MTEATAENPAKPRGHGGRDGLVAMDEEEKEGPPPPLEGDEVNADDKITAKIFVFYPPASEPHKRYICD